MTEIEKTQKETKDIEKENIAHQRTINVLQGGLARVFDILNLHPDGVWDREMLTHKRGSVLHRLGMLEYRAFELTQADLAVIASQHNPNYYATQTSQKFEAPDLLLPANPTTTAHTQKTFQMPTVYSDNEDDELQVEYGEEYDDTRTFTVKDFKEQALRYAKEHFNLPHQNNANQSSSQA